MNPRATGRVGSDMHARQMLTTVALGLFALASPLHAAPYEDDDGYVADAEDDPGDVDPVRRVARTADAPAALLATFDFDLVRLDDRRTTIYSIPDAQLTRTFAQPALVDERTGRWALTYETLVTKKRGTWTLVSGDGSGALGSPVQQLPCNRESIRCFEHATAFAAGSDEIILASLTRRGTTIATVDPSARRSEVAVGRSAGTRFALAPAQDRAVYATRSGLTIVPWNGRGIGRGKPTKVALRGELDNLVLTDDAVWFMREDTGRTTLERYDLAMRKRTTMYASPNLVAGWTPMYSRARNAMILVESDEHRVGDRYERKDTLVEVSSQGRGVIADNVSLLYDVSDDGRYVAFGRTSASGRAEVAIVDLATRADVRVHAGAPSAAAFVAR